VERRKLTGLLQHRRDGFEVTADAGPESIEFPIADRCRLASGEHFSCPGQRPRSGRLRFALAACLGVCVILLGCCSYDVLSM
jgi:hypothetical protein